MKKNDNNNIELVTITLSKSKTPIAFENKVEELIEECGLSREDAENEVEGMEIDMELYYEKNHGAYLVETDAVESISIYSPYTKEELEEIE